MSSRTAAKARPKGRDAEALARAHDRLLDAAGVYAERMLDGTVVGWQSPLCVLGEAAIAWKKAERRALGRAQ